MQPRDAMLLLKEKVKYGRSGKTKLKMFLRKSWVSGFENIDLERSYHSKGKTSSNKSRAIVCKFLFYKQKKEVLKNVKKLECSNIFIIEDFCFETKQRRKNIWREV